jgi:hypothetical protein
MSDEIAGTLFETEATASDPKLGEQSHRPTAFLPIFFELFKFRYWQAAIFPARMPRNIRSFSSSTKLSRENTLARLMSSANACRLERNPDTPSGAKSSV